MIDVAFEVWISDRLFPGACLGINHDQYYAKTPIKRPARSTPEQSTIAINPSVPTAICLVPQA